MHLLTLNLQRSSAINVAVYGNFSSPKNQEIVCAKGNSIELLRPDETGKLVSICMTPVFAIIRSILPFRLAGSNKDYLVIGSDSGKISVCEYDLTVNDWKVIHCEVFGKTGCRRIVPGQYLAADPRGRAIMIAGIEKQKFVYIMNRDAANRLTISSPLEAHKSETIVFSICGVDVGYDNPIFAMIELEYTEADQDPTGEAAMDVEKHLTYYELDLGLNHVVRKWSEPISRKANLLVAVPGGDDGPSGVLICGENWVSYKHLGHEEIRTALPRRHDTPPDKDILITTATTYTQKDMYFFLLQSEIGDLYKVTLEINENDRNIVENLIVTVFDSIQPCNSLCITKRGCLFAASEFGNHSLYRFEGIGDDPDAVRAEKIMDQSLNEELGDDAASASQIALTFHAQSRLNNLSLLDEIRSLAPITDLLVEEMSGDDSPQIHVLCGKGNRSSLRVLRHGISVTELAVSELPGRPTAVWTIRGSHESEYDRFIVVSFANATLVLSIGDTVEEVTDSGFVATACTLNACLLDGGAFLQVHANGITVIKPNRAPVHWTPPKGRKVEKASTNPRQVVISLQGGQIIYFELDEAGNLNEVESLDLELEVSCLDIGEIPEGRTGSPFLAVGCWDNTVRILSVEESDLLKQRSLVTLKARPESICFARIAAESKVTAAYAAGLKDASLDYNLYLHIGLQNGVMHRLAVDFITGSTYDARQRVLGLKSVKLFRVMVQKQRGVLALTNRGWLNYFYQGRHMQTPLSYEALEYASNFASELCPEGIVAVAGNTLRILAVDNLGSMFNQTVIPLRYTPRKMCRMPGTRALAIVESDHNEYNDAIKAQIAANSGIDSSKQQHEVNDETDQEPTYVPLRGPLPRTDGVWASCIRVVEPASGETHCLLELSDNEAAFSICTCKFTSREEETYLIVGTAKDLTLHPRAHKGCFIHVYRLVENTLQLLHKTDVEEVPLAMCEFKGKLLVGVGKTLRLYDCGKKKLLRKCQNELFPNMITKITTYGDRIYVGDMIESVHFAKYRRIENAIVIFADDTLPRFTTTITLVDHDTVCGADKFGCFFMLRVPEDVNDEVENLSGARLLWDQGVLNGAPNKCEHIAQYYLGETITSISKCSLFPGKTESLVCATVTGGIYCVLPLQSNEEIKFYQHLEMYMRQESTNLCQRDHLSYRSYFQPVKNVIDGDLCERYSHLPAEKQQELAGDIGKTPVEVTKRMEIARANIL